VLRRSWVAKACRARPLVLGAGYGYRAELERACRRVQARWSSATSPVALHAGADHAKTGQIAACNRLHSVDQQVCRWIMSFLDRSSSTELDRHAGDARPGLLGVRRESVTEAAGKLQEAGPDPLQPRPHCRARSPSDSKHGYASAMRSSNGSIGVCCNWRASSTDAGVHGACRQSPRLCVKTLDSLTCRYRRRRTTSFRIEATLQKWHRGTSNGTALDRIGWLRAAGYWVPTTASSRPASLVLGVAAAHASHWQHHGRPVSGRPGRGSHRPMAAGEYRRPQPANAVSAVAVRCAAGAILECRFDTETGCSGVVDNGRSTNQASSRKGEGTGGKHRARRHRRRCPPVAANADTPV